MVDPFGRSKAEMMVELMDRFRLVVNPVQEADDCKDRSKKCLLQPLKRCREIRREDVARTRQKTFSPVFIC